jgi:DNA-binding IscR family transcriptional regulator
MSTITIDICNDICYNKIEVVLMRVSTQFPIAVHALLMIAFSPVRVTSCIIAKSAGCNAVIIRNIFSKLKKAGLLSIKSGRSETTLAKPVENISLWDIYTAVETNKTEEIFKFHTNVSKDCPIGSSIRNLLINHLDDAVKTMESSLSSVTLEHLKNELVVLHQLSESKWRDRFNDPAFECNEIYLSE